MVFCRRLSSSSSVVSEEKVMNHDEYGRWSDLSEETTGEVAAVAAGYIDYISRVKTEREAVSYCMEKLLAAGFTDITACDAVGPGDRVCRNIKNKGVAAAVIGNAGSGFHIVAAHSDSPRLALKPKPFRDDTGLGYASLYARGGIKPYLWVDMPLAIHGIVATESGKSIELVIGENDDEGCFLIPDISLHASGRQKELQMDEAVRLQDLQCITGSIPSQNGAAESISHAVLDYLKAHYCIGPEEIVASELHLVPRGKALSLGFDRSLIAAFGQDDRICVYTGLQAILESGERCQMPHGQIDHTNVFFAIDREEIGSIGSTSANSRVYENFLTEIIDRQYAGRVSVSASSVFEKSKVISADVAILTGALEKDYSDMHNAALCGRGICLDKFMSSSNHEFVQWFLDRLNAHDVFWQSSMLGKGAVQFGGSVAASFAHKGMEVINAGPGILCSHAPYEIVSKLDLFMTGKAYSAFYG